MSDMDLEGLGEDELAGLNDPSVEHLPEPPVLTGRGQMSEMYGETARTPIGRPSSPPLFRQAAMFPQAQQLRIWRVENGVPAGLGVLPAEATEEDLVMAFPDAMPKPGEVRATFRIRPLDTNGQEIGEEVTVHISEHHAAIRALRRSREAAAQEGAGAPPAFGSGMIREQAGIMHRTLDAAERRITAVEEDLRTERQRLLERDHELARERVDLASNALTAQQAMAERMLEADQQRHAELLEMERQRADSAAKQQQTFMQTQLEMLRADREAILERMRIEAERERQRHQEMLEAERERRRQEAEEARRRREEAEAEFRRKLEQERLEFEQRMALERERLEREEAERRRQHEMRMKELEIRARHDREHTMKLAELTLARIQAQSGPNVMELIPKAVGTLKSLGIEPRDLISMLRGGGDWTDLVGTLVEKIGDVASTVVAAKAQQQAVQPQQQVAAFPSSTYPALPNAGGFDMGPGGLPLDDEEYPQPVPQPAQQPAVVRQAPQPAASSNLDLDTQRRARVALRELVGKLQDASEDEWEGLVMEAISNEMAIYHYCQDVSVRAALTEAGADPDLIDAVIDRLRANSAIPDDLRYE